MGDIGELSRVAAGQAGVFNIEQARAAGFASSFVRRRLADGQWLQVDDSVYAFAASPDTWLRSLWAAVLSRRQAAVTHLAAASLLGLHDVRKPPPVILTPRHSNVRSSLARVFESDQFDRIAKTSVDGLPVTTMPETILVLARDTDSSDLTGIFDRALVSGLLDLGSMSRTIDREAGRRTPGTPLLRKLVTSRRPGAPSKSSTYLERLLEQVLADSRVPNWTREAEILAGDRPSRVDVLIPRARLVVEADGRNWHTRQADFERDRLRDNALAAQGFQVLRFTYAMLSEDPEMCLRQVIATCLLRAA